MQELIEQIVREIVSGAGQLDDVRQRMFLVWLGEHASQLDCLGEVGHLAERLSTWLDRRHVSEVLWEYRLVLGEIEWWDSLEQDALERMVGWQA